MNKRILTLLLCLTLLPAAFGQTSGLPGFVNYATSTGSSTAYAVAQYGASLTPGQILAFLPNVQNTTTTPTLSLNSLTAATITKVGQNPVSAGDITTTAIAIVIYDGTYWELQNPQTLSSNGGTTGYMSWTAGTGTEPSLPLQSAGWMGPVSGGTSWVGQLPATISAGILHFATPAAVNGILASQVTSTLIGITDFSATGTPSSTTYLRGDNTWATVSGGGGVSAFSGDGNFANNSSSTGAVTLALISAGTHKFWGNNTGSTAAAGYQAIGVQDWSPADYVAGAGTAQAQTATFVPAITSLVVGLTVKWLPSAANTAVGPTLAVNGLTAKTITKEGTVGLVANDLLTTAIATAVYDGTDWELQNPQSSVTVAGGGTGVTAFTAYGVLYGGTTSTGTLQSLIPGAAKQLLVSGGTSAAPAFIDEPIPYYSPSANCVGTTAGSGWSIGASGTVTCKAGTNNTGGFVAITDTSSSFAQFPIHIPLDWDTGTNPYIRFDLSYPGADGSSAHTIIPAFKISCTGTAGTTTDDVAFNASHSSSTITLSSATTGLFFSNSNTQMNSTDVTGCSAGGMMIVQVGRATDTATSPADFYGATITFPRLLTVQAN